MSSILCTFWQCFLGMKDVPLSDFLTFNANLEMYWRHLFVRKLFFAMLSIPKKEQHLQTHKCTKKKNTFAFSGLSLVLNKEGL